MTDNFEKKVAVDGPVVNTRIDADWLATTLKSPGQALPAGPLGLGAAEWTSGLRKRAGRSAAFA